MVSAPLGKRVSAHKVLCGFESHRLRHVFDSMFEHNEDEPIVVHVSRDTEPTEPGETFYWCDSWATETRPQCFYKATVVEYETWDWEYRTLDVVTESKNIAYKVKDSKRITKEEYLKVCHEWT